MRMGKFYASPDMIQGEGAYELFAQLKFIPHRTEFLLHIVKIEYIGTSPLFREVAEGEKTLEYDLLLNHNEDGEIIQVLAQERIP